MPSIKLKIPYIFPIRISLQASNELKINKVISECAVEFIKYPDQ